MNEEYFWNGTHRAQQKYSEKRLPGASCPPLFPTWTGPGSNTMTGRVLTFWNMARHALTSPKYYIIIWFLRQGKHSPNLLLGQTVIAALGNKPFSKNRYETRHHIRSRQSIEVLNIIWIGVYGKPCTKQDRSRLNFVVSISDGLEG